MAEDVRVELTDRIPTIYSLANCCITVLPIFLILVWVARIELALRDSKTR